MIIKLMLATGLLTVLGFITTGVIFSRRMRAGTTREQRTNREAVDAFHSSGSEPRTVTLPPAREDLSDGAPKTLEDWLAEDERILLRAEVTEDLTWWSAWELRNDARAEVAADRLARNLLGHPDGITGLRADLLIEACHHDRQELVDLVNTTCAWPQKWEDELLDLLSEGVRA